MTIFDRFFFPFLGWQNGILIEYVIFNWCRSTPSCFVSWDRRCNFRGVEMFAFWSESQANPVLECMPRPAPQQSRTTKGKCFHFSLWLFLLDGFSLPLLCNLHCLSPPWDILVRTGKQRPGACSQMSLKGKVGWIWRLVLGGLQTQISWWIRELGDEAARWLLQQ